MPYAKRTAATSAEGKQKLNIRKVGVSWHRAPTVPRRHPPDHTEYNQESLMCLAQCLDKNRKPLGWLTWIGPRGKLQILARPWGNCQADIPALPRRSLEWRGVVRSSCAVKRTRCKQPQILLAMKCINRGDQSSDCRSLLASSSPLQFVARSSPCFDCHIQPPWTKMV